MNEFELFEEVINEIELSMPTIKKNKKAKISKKQKNKHKRNILKARIYTKIFVRKQKEKDTSDTYIKDIKVACILDEFSYNCFKYNVNLLPLTQDNYKKQLKEFKPQILLVESAWNSYEGGWKVSKQLDDIIRLLLYCKRRGIKTVFWNKEDPVHFYSYVKKAVYFDYIFTTDSNMIDEYKERTKKENVFSLMFAAQPKIQNPIKIYDEKEKKAVFAGTFYRNKYKERLRCLMRMLYISQKYGLDIYDRNYGKNNPLYVYPSIFHKNIVGNLAYADIAKAYKGYKVNLNINSVITSPTMLSRRVFEVLASNTPVISNPSPAIDRYFKDIVFTGETYDDFINIYEKLFKDEEFYKKICLQGLREVLTKHTYKKRLEKMFESIHLNFKKEENKIAVLGVCDEVKDKDILIKYYEKQNIENADFILVGPKIQNNQYKSLTKEKLVSYLKENNYNYICIFNPKNFYGKNYLVDLLTALEYIDNAEFIGKKAFYNFDNKKLVLENPDKEYTFSTTDNWDSGMISIKTFLENYNKNNILKPKNELKIFSIDSYNFVKDGTNKLTNEMIEKIEI